MNKYVLIILIEGRIQLYYSMCNNLNLTTIVCTFA